MNRHGRHLRDGVRARLWIETARRCGVPDREAFMTDAVSHTPAVIGCVQAAIPQGLPAQIADTILDGVCASALTAFCL